MNVSVSVCVYGCKIVHVGVLYEHISVNLCVHV